MIKERLSAYISNSDRSQTAIAKDIGISSSAITMYLKGKYGARDLSSIEDKIRTFLDKQDAREQLPPPLDLGFIKTEVSGIIFEVAERCRVYRRIGVVVGEAGVGKTTSITAYAKKYSDTVVVYAHRSMTLKGLFKSIARKIGVDDRGLTSDIFDRVSARLGDRLLIVDEAEHMTIPMLDELRRLSDDEYGKSGLLLVGLPRFVELVRSRQNDYAYLRNRISQSVRVVNLKAVDTEVMVKKAFPNRVNKEVCDLFYKYSLGNPRRLMKLFTAVYEVANHNNISVINNLLIESAAQMVEF